MSEETIEQIDRAIEGGRGNLDPALVRFAEGVRDAMRVYLDADRRFEAARPGLTKKEADVLVECLIDADENLCDLGSILAGMLNDIANGRRRS